MEDVTKTLRDAAYVVVGAGVLAFQKAQVRRVELSNFTVKVIQKRPARVPALAWDAGAQPQFSVFPQAEPE